MAKEYTYRASACSIPGRSGLASCESSTNPIQFSDALELGRLEGVWSPEEILLCALAGSFTTTFHEIARSAAFRFTDLEVVIEASVRRKENQGSTFAEILLRPRLTVFSCDRGKDQCKSGLALLRKTHELCMISRAITAPQILEPCVETLKIPVEGWSQAETVKLGV